MESRPAVFLDRDGTINEEIEYLGDPARLRLLPGAAEAIRLLNRAGLPVLVVTNQSGVGRGYFAREAVEAVHERLHALLEAHGARVDGISYCPHHPDDGCDCRKPRPGLLLRAAREHRIDLARSYLAGDKRSDLEAGRRAGCRTILVLTGYGAAQRPSDHGTDAPPDLIVADLHQAALRILDDLQGPAYRASR